MRAPEEITVALPCPHCTEHPTIRVPMTTEVRGTRLTVNVEKRPIRLAVAAHMRQHGQP